MHKMFFSFWQYNWATGLLILQIWITWDLTTEDKEMCLCNILGVWALGADTYPFFFLQNRELSV